MRRRAALALVLAAAAFGAQALDQPQWPPPPQTVARMHELQQVLIDPASTPRERDAARQELSGLLRSPAGQARADEKPARPARAAIDPFPSVVKPYDRVPAPPALPPETREGVARVEVVEPPKPIIIPRTGQPALPAGNGFLIDPQGHVYHPIPGGYVDPRTGQIIPR